MKLAPLLRVSAALAGGALLAGCASVHYADGKTVAVRHVYQAPMADLQKAADTACVQSGGKAPAQFVSSMPMAQVAVAFSDWTYTFRCAS